MSFDPDTLDGILKLAGQGQADVASSIARAPELRLTTAGANVLVIVCNDQDHEIPAAVATGLTATVPGVDVVDDVEWWLCAVKRLANGRTVLVFEDEVAQRLRAIAGNLMSIPAGSTTVNELATRLTLPYDVDTLLEPTRQTVMSAFRVAGSHWSALGDLAAEAGRWRYSDGHQLVLGSPAWLLQQESAATVVEDQNGTESNYNGLDYDLHGNKDLETASANLVGAAPGVGLVNTLDVPGPASGAWLVASYVANLGEDSGRVTWARPSTATWSRAGA